MCVFPSVGVQTEPVLQVWPCMLCSSFSERPACERENTKLRRLSVNERGEDMKCIFSSDLHACLYLLRSAHVGLGRGWGGVLRGLNIAFT